MYYAGIDVGGTKCAVVVGLVKDGDISVISKEKFETFVDEPYKMMDIFKLSLYKQLEKCSIEKDELKGIGISCGGPLDSQKGVIMSPPNLPKWDNIAIVDFFEKEFQVKTFLQNDANACAIAEWMYGAGKGSENMIFLTFGTGFGAGLILDSKIYCGACDMAGEIGHIRAVEDGPESYGKAGSFEGFCSGNGIAKIGQSMFEQMVERGEVPEILSELGSIEEITAKKIAEHANKGDKLCIEIYKKSGEMLGRALSMLVDLLNPEVIVIGSIFARSHNLLWESCKAVMEKECLECCYSKCSVRPSYLGDSVGDIAALATAVYAQ